MPKTLLQTILAAFCAILCATSMGGGGMNIGARIGCWSGGNLTYIKNGLIHWYDGIDNTSAGHDSQSAIWEDLVGSENISIVNDGWGTNNLQSKHENSATGNNIIDSNSSVITLEVCAKTVSGRNFLTCGFTGQSESSRGAALEMFWQSDLTRMQMANGYVCTALKGISGLTQGNTYTFGNVFSKTTPIGCIKAYCNGDDTNEVDINNGWLVPSKSQLKLNGSGSAAGTILFYSIRVYDRELSKNEFAANYAVDKARFGLT